jgi:hypothetical protein
VTAPKLRRLPWVGDVFEIREARWAPLVRVALREIKHVGEDPLHYLERL